MTVKLLILILITEIIITLNLPKEQILLNVVLIPFVPVL